MAIPKLPPKLPARPAAAPAAKKPAGSQGGGFEMPDAPGQQGPQSQAPNMSSTVNVSESFDKSVKDSMSSSSFIDDLNEGMNDANDASEDVTG